MVTPLKAAPGALLEPDAPSWAQRFALRLRREFAGLRPTQPQPVFICDKADLPPAADWPGCVVLVADQACLGVADAGVWRKVAFGGPV